MGLVLEANGLRQLADEDWQALMPLSASALRTRLDELNGHFVLVRWSEHNVQAFTDVLGTRTLYYARRDGHVHWATRLDVLAKHLDHSSFNLNALGAHWLTFNQLSYTALLEGVERLGPGGVLRYNRADDRLTATSTRWKPDPNALVMSPMAVLGRLLRVQLAGADRTVSLGLSGGLDSRLLLALLSSDDADYALHTFGDASDPDVLLSEQLAQAAGAPRQHLTYPDPSADEVLSIIQRHVVQTCATIPATAALKLAAYAPLEAQQRLMVDGGFGEIGRRQFLNRLRYRRPMRTRAEALFPAFAVSRADVFASEVKQALQRGAEAQLAEVYAAARNASVEGFANRLDLLSIWTRLPNFFGHEQARLDGEVVNYMPFAQPAFLQTILATPLAKRQHGRLYKRTIRRLAPPLADLPLAKSGTTYPFGASTLGAWAVTQVKKRWGERYADVHRLIYLERLEPIVRDLALDAQRVAMYDAAHVEHLISSFYNGDASLAVPVDWWLAFELWRRSIQQERPS
ncbi:MAG: hypothetical protein RhofKO_39700 [Rhodothermales bacterium]